MKLVPTRRTDYAIRAMIHLAQQDPAGFAKADEIADAMDVPRSFVPQILQELQRARLVRSRPGRSGGYVLARLPEQISILEIVEALEGGFADVDCALRGGPCRWNDVCALHWVWSEARHALEAKLREATLAKVADDDRALAAGTRKAPPDSHRSGRRRATPREGSTG